MVDPRITSRLAKSVPIFIRRGPGPRCGVSNPVDESRDPNRGLGLIPRAGTGVRPAADRVGLVEAHRDEQVEWIRARFLRSRRLE